MRFIQLIARLPLPILYRFSDLLYILIAYVVRYRRGVITTNLQQSFPERTQAEISRLRQGFYRNFCDIIVEVLKLPGLSAEEMKARVRYTNPGVIQAEFAKGKPVLCVAGHQCNWEWVPIAAELYGLPVDSVYKPLHSPFFERVMHTLRSRFGSYPVPMGRLPREMVARRHTPRVIALVADQMPDHPEAAYWTEFMHRETPFFPGLERLARSQQLAVFYTEMVRVGRGQYTITFAQLGTPPYAELATGELIDRYRDALTATLNRYPTDWLWSHKRWKHEREKYGENVRVKLK
jgi:Kdo2-lipid IVA lauroyltransferase/acyltransferase